jgi:hypothetical protein
MKMHVHMQKKEHDRTSKPDELPRGPGRATWAFASDRGPQGRREALPDNHAEEKQR